MINKNEWLIVGLITSPQGINGELKVKSLSDFEERFTIAPAIVNTDLYEGQVHFPAFVNKS